MDVFLYPWGKPSLFPLNSTRLIMTEHFEKRIHKDALTLHLAKVKI